MSKCTKVKNPCKICLAPVTQKTGLQCQGACESWVHYACLNYTPGRIKDIKAGIIKVTCPCPDCKTTLPKEFRTDEPFSCTNVKCPANRPPQCENQKCPMNAGNEKMLQTSGYAMQVPCGLGKCGTECRQHLNLMSPLAGGPPLNPPCAPHSAMFMSSSSSDPCLDFKKCLSCCSSTGKIAGDNKKNIPKVPLGAFPSLGTMEQISNTIGLLSKQINAMMAQMRNATQGCCPVNRKTCTQPGPKSLCPKPCFCPDNPGTKKC
jgi:hypothetical protein